MITPKMIITFPAVYEKVAFEPGDEPKWGAGFLLSKAVKKNYEAFMPEMMKAYRRGIKKGHWKDVGLAKMMEKFRYQPLRDGDAEHVDNGGDKDSPEYKGHYFFSSGAGVKDKDQPGVVDQSGKPMFDESELYSGRIVRADISAFPYKVKGNIGIGWWLNNVMVFMNDDCKRLDGKQDAEDAFSGFTEDEGEDNLA